MYIPIYIYYIYIEREREKERERERDFGRGPDHVDDVYSKLFLSRSRTTSEVVVRRALGLYF